ncbi:hypothetical protein [Aliamphritea ceti]|uniref:hypothetical protein n=1 Tax=Aliamphritea ceti TaxID=1524258 RepID=UPI0021C44AEC|nr:hypothetical protein [Aliamphritea ceti]
MDDIIAVKRNNRHYRIYYVLAALIPVYITYIFHFSIPAILLTTFVCSPLVALLVFAGWIKKGKPSSKIMTDVNGINIVLNEHKTVSILWQDISKLQAECIAPNQTNAQLLFVKYKEGVRNLSPITESLNNFFLKGYEPCCPIHGYNISPDEIVTQLSRKHKDWLIKKTIRHNNCVIQQATTLTN